MTVLTRDELFAQTLPTERVPLPWLGNDKEVIVRGMSARALDAYARMIVGNDDPNSSPRSYVFVQCVVNEDGKRLYSDEDLDQIADNVDTAIIDVVVDAANRMSEISEERKAALKKTLTTPLTAVPSGE